MPTAQKLLEILRAEIGYHEKASKANLESKTANSGSNNWNKYAEELNKAGYYGGNLNGQPWCAILVDWAFFKLCGDDPVKAQEMQCQTGSCGASCTYSANYYKAAGRWSTTPYTGAEIFFGSPNNIEHTGIVESYDYNKVTTIEGNASDQVARRTYDRNSPKIVGYGIPKFDGTASKVNTSTVSTLSLRYGDKGEAVKEMQKKLIVLGFDCGVDGADGDFGTNTYNAVVRFQKSVFPNDESEWDGICGAKTFAKLNAETKSKASGYVPKVGDIVQFTGDTHYISADSKTGRKCKSGKAKVTLITNLKFAHPYHLVRVIGGGSDVYGFVDGGTFYVEED